MRPLCERCGLPYTSGPWWKQYGQVLRTLLTLSLPDRRGSGGDDPDDGARLRATSAPLPPPAPQPPGAGGTALAAA